jgi:alpha-amylase
LPDLDTENEYVIRELKKWVKWVVEEYDFDAIRIDTVKHVRKDFWKAFADASGVFSIGEVLHGDPQYVGPYQRQMDSMLNFPLYFTIRDVFQYKQSMWGLEVRYEQNEQYFRDVSLLGNFIDNHDFKRFCNQQKGTSWLV